MRAIGNDLHMDYSAVGQTTHLAARMEQLARPGTALLTVETLRLVESYVEVTPLGLVPVKGLHEPVEVYELVRAGPVRSRLQAAVARGLTRFVGRDAELEHLRQALTRAGAGQGQVVASVGEAGVGKSRPALRVHPVAPHAWLAVAGQPCSLLWQGDRLPPHSLPAQGLLPDRTPGTTPAVYVRKSRASC